MTYGQLPGTKYQSMNGITVNDWVEVDMSPSNLRKNGLKAKRGWDGIIEFKVTHIFDTYFVGLTGSLHNMCIPFKMVLNGKQSNS